MVKEYVKPAIMVANVEMESLLAASPRLNISGEEATKDEMNSNRFHFMEEEGEE